MQPQFWRSRKGSRLSKQLNWLGCAVGRPWLTWSSGSIVADSPRSRSPLAEDASRGTLPVIAPALLRLPSDHPTGGRRDGDVVTEHLAAAPAQRKLPHRRQEHHSARVARRGQFVPADAHLVSDRDGAAEAQGGRGDRGRSTDGEKKGLIELAYHVAERVGIPVWGQDEAGPYQAIPQPGQSWQLEGRPVCQPQSTSAAEQPNY